MLEQGPSAAFVTTAASAGALGDGVHASINAFSPSASRSWTPHLPLPHPDLPFSSPKVGFRDAGVGVPLMQSRVPPDDVLQTVF